MQLSPLRTLLGQRYSFDTCRVIAGESATLYREPLEFRWYFLLLNRIFSEIIGNPDFHEADTIDPILDVVFEYALKGVDAAEQGNVEVLLLCANQLTEAYTAIP